MCLQHRFLMCNFLPATAMLMLIICKTQNKAFPNLSFSLLGLKNPHCNMFWA